MLDMLWVVVGVWGLLKRVLAFLPNTDVPAALFIGFSTRPSHQWSI